MKTKELIKKLSEIDPDGNMEVCVGNRDIVVSTHSEPAYWDGRLQKVSKRDKYGRPEETTIETGGSKINLYTVDLFDIYTDSIVDDGKEYTIKTNGGLPKSYSWLDADWTASKVNWLIWVEKYIKRDMESSNKFVDDAGNKLKLIDELKEKYRKQTTDALKSYAKDRLKKKQRESAIKLVDNLTEKRPLILDVFRHGKDYAAMSGALWKGHEFRVYEDGSVEHKRFSEKEWQVIDLEKFEFNEVFEEFDKLQEKRFWEL